MLRRQTTGEISVSSQVTGGSRRRRARQGYPGLTPDGSVIYSGGSSAAAACVTGIAALVKSANPALNAAEIAAVLKAGTKKLNALQNQVMSGGIIERMNALKKPRRWGGGF